MVYTYTCTCFSSDLICIVHEYMHGTTQSKIIKFHNVLEVLEHDYCMHACICRYSFNAVFLKSVSQKKHACMEVSNSIGVTQLGEL